MGEQADDPPGSGLRQRGLGEGSRSTEQRDREESTGGSRSGMTRVPREVQRAVARLADSNVDVYHVLVEVGPSASERDRGALVTGLEDSQTALELLETGTDDSDELEFVTAPRFGIETVTDAIERCSFVEGVTARRLLATTETNGRNLAAVPSGRGAASSDGGEPVPSDSSGPDSSDEGEPASSNGGESVPSPTSRGEHVSPFALPDDEVSLPEVIEQAHEATDEGSDDDTGTAGGDGAGGEAADRSSQRSRGGDPEAWDGSDDRPESAIDARVTRLESRFAQFEAYVDELETLLDRQSVYQRRVARVEAAIDDLESSVEEIDDESARHRRKIAAVHDAVEAAARERDDLADALHDLQDCQARLEDDVEAMSSWRERVSEAMRATKE